MWSRHTFSPACLEPTRTGVWSPEAKMEREVGVRIQEPEDVKLRERAPYSEQGVVSPLVLKLSL